MASITNQVRDEAQQWGPRLLSGALAGLLASIPMGLVMIGLNRILPARKRSWYTRWIPEPPKQITNRVMRRVGLPRGAAQVTKSWDPLTWLAHLGYGAGTASLYPLVTRPIPLPGVLRGILFALGIWAASYMGWLPAADLLPPATRQPARRNVVMIASHLVWGSLIGLLAKWINQRFENRQASPGASRV